MKPQFELSKNVFILILLAIIGGMTTYIVVDKLTYSNKENTAEKAFIPEPTINTSPFEKAILFLETQNAELVRQKDSVARLYGKVKDQAAYYKKLSRKDAGKIVDSTQYKYWNKPHFFSGETLRFANSNPKPKLRFVIDTSSLDIFISGKEYRLTPNKEGAMELRPK